MQRSGARTSRQGELWLQSPGVEEFLFGGFEFSVRQKPGLMSTEMKSEKWVGDQLGPLKPSQGGWASFSGQWEATR